MDGSIPEPGVVPVNSVAFDIDLASEWRKCARASHRHPMAAKGATCAGLSARMS